MELNDEYKEGWWQQQVLVMDDDDYDDDADDDISDGNDNGDVGDDDDDDTSWTSPNSAAVHCHAIVETRPRGPLPCVLFIQWSWWLRISSSSP